MVVGRRGPNLNKTTCWYEVLVAHSIPEWTADGAGVGLSVQNRAQYFHFTRSRVTMFTYVDVKAQRLVVASLAQALLL